MLTRILSALVGIVILVLVVFSENIMVLRGALAVCSAIGIYELYKAFGVHKMPFVIISGLAVCEMAVFQQFIPAKFIGAAVFVYIIILACRMLYNNKTFTFEHLALSVLGTVYIALPIWSLISIRNEKQGLFLLFIALGGAWVTDTFAYFCGRAFGKHKLCPVISPKKTVEGSVGGTICTIIASLIYGYCINRFANISVNYIALGAITLICAAVSQIGDLTASIIKRERGIKDFGNIMPGHGGFMDRFDSTLFVAPAVYIFSQIFTIFG